MNELWTYVYSPAAATWSVLLLHFVWQGCLIAAITSVFLRWSKPNDSGRRYLVTVAGMMCMAVIPMATLARLAARDQDPSPRTYAKTAVSPQSKNSILLDDSRTWSASSTMATQAKRSFEPTRIDQIHACLFAFWVIAEGLLATRLALGSIFLWRIRRRSAPVSTEFQDLAKRLANRLGLRRVPSVLASADIHDAATYGFLRSIVLLPASWLTEMSPEMIEAVLAHELSHIRRHDVWVNLLQRLVETVFFYHPAVWWLSKQIRIEREHSCDAMAVQLTGNRSVFAKTLEAAARQRASLQFALVSNLGDDKMALLNRVHRVLNTQGDRRRPNRWPFGLVAMFVPILLVISSTKTESLAVDPPAKTIRIESPPLDAPSKELLIGVIAPPSELAKVTLPDYVIEPPDILLIEAIKTVPKSPHKIARKDVLQVVAHGTPQDRLIAGQYIVESSGNVTLGPGYGRVELADLTIDQATTVVRERIIARLNNPKIQVAVSLFQAAGKQYITGEHLVASDGTVNLGIYGQVYVAGKTVKDATQAVEKHLLQTLAEVDISLSVHEYNSKVYYVIRESELPIGDHITRVPVTGSETVLDAIAQVGDLGQASTATVWLSRPSKFGDATAKTLPVDWKAITRGATTGTNYQLMPGDRLFISQRKQGIKGEKGESNFAPVFERFNRLVKQRKYQEAIRCARESDFKATEDPVFESLQLHANLLAENLAALNIAERREVAHSIGAIRLSRLAALKTQQALRTPIAARFDGVTLEQAIGSIAEQLDINIVIDQDGLAAEGVTNTQSVSLQLRKKIRAKSILLLLLEPRRLKYVLTEDGVVQITSESRADGNVYSEVYYVDDLIGLPIIPYEDGDATTSNSTSYRSLASLITLTVEPDSWDDVGGPGTVQALPAMQSLVISANSKTHLEISELLQEIRAAAKPLKKNR